MIPYIVSPRDIKSFFISTAKILFIVDIELLEIDKNHILNSYIWNYLILTNSVFRPSESHDRALIRVNNTSQNLQSRFGSSNKLVMKRMEIIRCLSYFLHKPSVGHLFTRSDSELKTIYCDC